MKTVRHLPVTHSPSGWNAILPPRTPHPALQGEKDFDWLVIGAGYAGVAAARRLAEQRPAERIAVLEAHIVGENAAGKNSGFAIDLPHFSDNNIVLREEGMAEIRLNRRTIAALEAMIRRYQIDCGWRQSGRYHAAVTRDLGEPLLANYRRNLHAWQEPYRDCTAADLAEELGTRYYHAAVFTAGTYLLNPAALIRGLADHLPANVTLFEQSPVLSFDFGGEHKIARSAQGSIRSGNVILAVNTHLGQFGLHRWRQVPMVLYATLTEPLSGAEAGKLGSNPDWGITPAHGTVGASMRLTHERRLLMRHGFNYSPTLDESAATLARAREHHIALLQQRFPGLDFTPAQSWMGWLPISHNHRPLFGRAAPGVHLVSCCNGAGLVRHSAAGALIADMALGEDNPDIATYLHGGQASLLPPRPLLDLGIKTVAGWQLYRGRREA